VGNANSRIFSSQEDLEDKYSCARNVEVKYLQNPFL